MRGRATNSQISGYNSSFINQENESIKASFTGVGVCTLKYPWLFYLYLYIKPDDLVIKVHKPTHWVWGKVGAQRP